MSELDEAELTRLQNDAVAVMAASTDGNPKDALPPEAAAVVLAVPALCDEVRYYYDQAIAAQRRMEGLEVEGRQLYAALRRSADGMHTGDYEDSQAALVQADALITRLAERYEPERF